MLRNFFLVVLGDLVLRDLPVCEHLEYLMCTLLVVGAILKYDVGKCRLPVIVAISLLVLGER